MHESVEIIRGTTEPLDVVYYANGTLVTGASLTVAISRTSDGNLLDFADRTFKASPGSGTQALTESPSGTYGYAWDTSTIVNPVSAGTPESYLCILRDATNGRNVVAYELRIRALDATHTLAAAGATSSALSTAQSDLTAIKGVGFTTGDDLHAIRARGDAAWVTATGFAVAGDAMTLTTGERSSVGTAVWATATRTITGTASGALTATSFASGALGAAWDEATASHVGAGSFGAFFAAQLDVATGSRLAAAAYTSPPSAATISAAVVDQALSGHTTTGTVGAGLAHLDADVSTRAATGAAMSLTPTERTTVQALVLSDATPFPGARIDATVSSRLAAASYTAAPTASTVAAAVWATVVPGSFTAGEAGYVLGTNLDATVGSRLATSGYTSPPTASAIASQVDTTLSGVHGAGAWGSNGGLSLQQIVDGVWDEATSAHSTAGSFAALVKANLDVAVGSRLATASYSAAPSASTVSAAVWAETARTLTAATNLSALASQVSVDAIALTLTHIPTLTPLTSNETSAAVWGALVASFTPPGSFGALLGANLDTTVSSRSTLAAGSQMALTAGAITAVQSGMATTAQLGTTQTAIITAMPAAAPTASAVAAAVAGLSLTAYTDATTLGGAVRLTRIFSTWTSLTPTKKVYNAGTSKIDVYADDGTTVLHSVPIHDYLGAAVVPSAGDPYQIG